MMDQWDPRDLHMQNRDYNGRNQITKVELGHIEGPFIVSSGEVWNSLIYEISDTLEDERLEELVIQYINSVNGTIEAWPLGQIE